MLVTLNFGQLSNQRRALLNAVALAIATGRALIVSSRKRAGENVEGREGGREMGGERERERGRERKKREGRREGEKTREREKE